MRLEVSSQGMHQALQQHEQDDKTTFWIPTRESLAHRVLHNICISQVLKHLHNV